MPARSKPQAKPRAKPQVRTKATLAQLLSGLTGAELRARAREALGSGHSKLKTKAELIAALLAVGVAKAAQPKAAKGGARVIPRAQKGSRLAIAKGTAEETLVADRALSGSGSQPSQKTKLAGASAHAQRLAELAERYYDDSFVSLPLGPDTLFFYWDFKPETEAAARDGLQAPRAVLTLYSGGRAVEHIDFALENRAYYVRKLEPGETYEAEIFFVGENGERRRLGRPSNSVTLPPRGASPIVDDRFVTFPWGAPLGTAEHPYVVGPPGFGRTPPGGPLGSSPTGPVGRGARFVRPAPGR